MEVNTPVRAVLPLWAPVLPGPKLAVILEPGPKPATKGRNSYPAQQNLEFPGTAILSATPPSGSAPQGFKPDEGSSALLLACLRIEVEKALISNGLSLRICPIFVIEVHFDKMVQTFYFFIPNNTPLEIVLSLIFCSIISTNLLNSFFFNSLSCIVGNLFKMNMISWMCNNVS